MNDIFLLRKDEYYYPERHNRDITMIKCERCLKEIKKTELKNQYKITPGFIVKDYFISDKKSFYYNVDCMGE